MVGSAVKPGTVVLTGGVATERVEFQAFHEWQPKVVEPNFLRGIGITDSEVLAFKGVFARIEPDGFYCHSAVVIFDFERIISRSALICVYPIVLPGACESGAVGAGSVAPFSREIEETRFTDFHPVVGVPGPCIAIAFVGLSPVEVSSTAVGIIFQHDINNTSNGIGTVLCSCPVSENFDAFYRCCRNGVEVGASRATAYGGVDVQERAFVAAFAVDKHQRLVGPKPPQRCGTERVCTVTNG